MTTGTPDPVREALERIQKAIDGRRGTDCGDMWFEAKSLTDLMARIREICRAALSLSPASPFVPVQKCPVCDGQGHLSKPPQVPGDQPTWTSSSTASHPCHRCKGVGTVAMSPASEAVTCPHGTPNGGLCEVCIVDQIQHERASEAQGETKGPEKFAERGLCMLERELLASPKDHVGYGPYVPLALELIGEIRRMRVAAASTVPPRSEALSDEECDRIHATAWPTLAIRPSFVHDNPYATPAQVRPLIQAIYAALASSPLKEKDTR